MNSDLKSEKIRDIIKYDESSLLIGTVEGLYLYNLRNDEVKLFSNDSDLADSWILNLYRDKKEPYGLVPMGRGFLE
ncbi:hypothetical protein [Mangrovivirga cuniculi]|uniref:Uncharacterized protein n=1 Tax=Mangrovivirga cuniculi TaxID=2715131 RepID=A0A4D7JW22_9BACT|nr:hypothetical protein [Mangrovivirga cuniculi]QCK15015.1 hypothetical protein DCC35_09790 [Mangrovivirga cuniculi]